MAAYRGLFSLSRSFGLLQSRVARSSLRRLASSDADVEMNKIQRGTWRPVAKILAVPAVFWYFYTTEIRPALDEGVPEGVHVFTWLIARCLMCDLQEEERIMEEHLVRMRDMSDDYLIAKEMKVHENLPLVSGSVAQNRAENSYSLFEEVGPDGF